MVIGEWYYVEKDKGIDGHGWLRWASGGEKQRNRKFSAEMKCDVN